MNIELFKFFMALHRDTGKTLAKALGMHESTLSKKLNGDGTTFDLNDLDVIRERYNLNSSAFYAIFFNIKVELNSTCDIQSSTNQN